MSVSVLDVAAYIIKKQGPMSAMKLQKLAYYSQAWSLVWDNEPMFSQRIEAWRDGPVAPKLYSAHRGVFYVEAVNGDPSALSQDQIETVDAILSSYGQYDGATLSRMTHDEAPWKLARKGLPETANCDHEITHASMKAYYSAL